MNIPKFLNYTKQKTKRKFKRKFVTQKLLYENDNCISSSARVTYNDEDHIYVNCYITYMHNMVFLNKKRRYTRKVSMIDKEILLNRSENEKKIEDKVRQIMKENISISPKEISKLTRFSIYAIYKCYMKIRRENSIKKC